MTADLSFDRLGYARYHGQWIRRPQTDGAEWGTSSGDHPHDPDGHSRDHVGHDSEAEAKRHIRNIRVMEIADEYAEMRRDGIDVAVSLFLPDDEVTERCLNYEDILRVVCSHLELPQSESGPSDDIHLYDRALDAADLYTRLADADLAENKRMRFAAEADLQKLLEALDPFAEAAGKLPDPRDLVEGATRWAIMEAEFLMARAGLNPEVFRRILLIIEQMNPAYRQRKGTAA